MCVEGTCQLAESCDVLFEEGVLESGPYRLTSEGRATLGYCLMGPAEAGWTLISVVGIGDEGGLIANQTCATASSETRCKGHMPASAQREGAEVLIADLSSDTWMVLSGWSGRSDGGLARLSGEVEIPDGGECGAACGQALDPNLRVAATSGFPAPDGPIAQWWRFGGLWLGAGESPGNPCGAVAALGYHPALGIWGRGPDERCATLHSESTLAVFWR